MHLHKAILLLGCAESRAQAVGITDKQLSNGRNVIVSPPCLAVENETWGVFGNFQIAGFQLVRRSRRNMGFGFWFKAAGDRAFWETEADTFSISQKF